LVTFGNFWLTIHNTANWHVSNAFDLLSVFISFPLARCCCCGSCGFLLLLLLLLLLLRAPTRPRPPFLGEGSTKKRKSPVASELVLGHVCVGVGVVEVVLMSRCTAKRWVYTLETRDC
jgi:hypothetical protein